MWLFFPSKETLAMARDYYDAVAASQTREERAAFKGYSAYDRFEQSLRGASYVLAHIYEWESGL
jgi:hypothetical protein